jgi:adenylosuccinate lyase
LQRTEVLEVEEFFSEGQKGSSAMPHKRNPITFERLTGLARIIRANALAALENIALWHERDISHSSVERIIMPDSTIALCYILRQFTDAIEKLIVYPERMLENFERSYGLIFSQAVLLALTQKGLAREEAYQLVQRNAMQSWKEHVPLKTLVQNDSQIRAYLSEKEIEQIFSSEALMKKMKKNVDYIFRRVGLTK